MHTHTILKIAVIGLGHQSVEDHIPAIRASKDVQFVAIAEINKEKLDKFLSENNDVHSYTSTEEMFKKEKLDLVIIALPHYMYQEVMKQAIENKVHVLKEKPFAMSLKEAKEIRDLANKNNVQVSVTLQRRFNPIYSTFFQLLDKIGDPFYIESKYTFYTDSPHTGWRGEKSWLVVVV